VKGTRTVDAVVIGGGIIGAATTYYLARQGLKIALLEKDRLATGSTGASVAGVRQQGRSKVQLPLMFTAVNLWQGLEDELGAPVDYVQTGHLMLAGDEEVLEFYRSGPNGVEEQTAAGLRTYIVDRQEARELAPVLEGPFVGGRYCPTDGGAHPQKAVGAFARAAQRLGCTIMERTAVTGLRVEGARIRGVRTSQGDIEAIWVINAASVWAREIGSWAGLDVPIVPIRGQVLFSTSLPPLVRPFVFHGDVEGLRLFIRQRPDGHILTGLGNPLQEEGWDTTVDEDFGFQLRRRLKLLAPSLADIPAERMWGGLYEVTPDTEPIIDIPQESRGLVLSCGFSAQGFGPGPAVGYHLAQWIATGVRPEILAPFALSRFQEGTAPRRQLLAEMSGKREPE